MSDLLLVEGRRHLDAQIRAYRDVDQRAVEILRANGLLLTIAAAAVSFAWRAPERTPSASAIVPAVAAFGAIALSSIFAGIAYRSGAIMPGLTGLASELVDTTSREATEKRVVEAYETMIGANRRTIERKGRMVERGLAVLLGAIALITVSAGALMLGGA